MTLVGSIAPSITDTDAEMIIIISHLGRRRNHVEELSIMRLELFVLGVIAPGVWPTHNVVERQDARCRCSAVLILIMALVDLGVDVSKPTDTVQIVVRRRANGYEQAQTRSLEQSRCC